MSETRLIVLAKAIIESVGELEAYFQTNKLPTPSFDEHAPPDLPLSTDMQPVRQRAVDAVAELQHLLIGPAMQLRPVLNATSLQAIYRYEIAAKVPLNGQIPFAELAEKVGPSLELSDLKRILRFAMIHHRVFQEKEPGIVSHTAASRLLVESPEALAALGFMFDECYQSFGRTLESLEVFDDHSPAHSGWALAHNVSMPMWEYHTLHPSLGERAARAMSAFTKGFGTDISALTSESGYDWSRLDSEGGVLVDLGGASGYIACEIARGHPGIRCIVQEIPEVVAKAMYSVPEELADRVTFAAHDFFEPQPISAGVYLFRQILHNWSDACCKRILRALIPGLRPGARVLVNDVIVPEPGTLLPTNERALREMDMIMLSLFRSRERSRGDWEKLFSEADSRFGEPRVWQPEGSQLGLIEAVWSG